MLGHWPWLQANVQEEDNEPVRDIVYRILDDVALGSAIAKTLMGQQLFAEAITLKTRKKTKHVYEGQYVAEVEVELIEDESGWTPYLNIDDAYKLDDVREALRRLDLKSAAQYGRIYELRLVAV